MNPYQSIISALDRITTATSVIRTRAEDAARLERHGGANGDISNRVAEAAKKLEAVALATEKGVS